ncbi:MAG: hypothetical protein [Circular genetic element sp.]|nr:MAG: hypothetical protein [Circular genetic element sp.]
MIVVVYSMSRTNKTKLVSLDDECWRILQTESKPRMQSVYVRNAIRDYYRRRQANTTTELEIEQQDIIKDVLDQRDEALMKVKGLEKRLEQHIEKERPGLKKWWHFFFIGMR